MAEAPKEEIKTSKTMKEAVREVNELMMDNPHGLTVELKFEDGKSFYQHRDMSTKAKSMRKKAGAILEEAWQGGAYNYSEIADMLRVGEVEIQALLDEDFKERIA